METGCRDIIGTVLIPSGNGIFTGHSKKVLKEVGIDFKKYSWKELRHTTASLMHRKGVPALAIKEQLRHTNIKTTVEFYIGADLAYQREQLEKLILNSGKIVGNEQKPNTNQIATA